MNKLLLFTLSLVISLHALAADPNTYYLFPENAHEFVSSELYPVEGYDDILTKLSHGDILAFHDANKFEFIEHLGSGGTTYVCKVKALTGKNQGRVMSLRLPIQGELLKNAQNWSYDVMSVNLKDPAFRLTFSFYIDDMLVNLENFGKHGFAPEYYQSLAGQYIALEHIDIKFSMNDYLSGKIPLSKAENLRVENALLDFATKTAGISRIKDIGQPGNVVFDGQRFILIDWYDVSFIKKSFYPWAFYEWESLVGYVLEHLKIRPRHNERTKEINRIKKFQERLEAVLDHRKRVDRLEMLKNNLNPITGETLTDNHNFWKRYFGSWRKIYTDLRKIDKIKQCKQFLLSFEPE